MQNILVQILINFFSKFCYYYDFDFGWTSWRPIKQAVSGCSENQTPHLKHTAIKQGSQEVGLGWDPHFLEVPLGGTVVALS